MKKSFLIYSIMECIVLKGRDLTLDIVKQKPHDHMLKRLF